MQQNNHPNEFEKYRVYNSDNDNTLVFLHGYADAMDMFYPFVDNFRDYKMVLINFPMNKYLEERSFSVEDLAQYTKDILDGINCKSYQLIGFSLGGVVAIELANIDKEKIESLTLLSSYPQLISDTQVKIIRFFYPILNSSLSKYIYSRVNTTPFIRKLFSSPFTPQKTLEKMKSNYKTVFGTLIRCSLYNGIQKYKNLNIPKEINLFKEDTVLKYSDISKKAIKDNIEIETHNGGGHYIDDDYFEKTIFDDTAKNYV